MPFTWCGVLSAVVCCGLAIETSAGDDKPLLPDAAAIKAFVAYLEKNGVKLEANERNWWVVTIPRGDGHQVDVSLKTFPEGTSEQDMQATLQSINLAHMLNAPSRLAMSKPGLRATDAAKQLPKLDQVPVVAKLEKLFTEYRPPRDPVYSHLPDAIRKVFEDTFPNQRCIRLVIRGEKDAIVYRATVFDPASMGTSHERVGGEHVATPPLYHLELDATGKVLEETLRPIDPKQLPKAAAAAYEKWNPRGVKGQEFYWRTEVPRGKDRVYRVHIIVNAIKAYAASFNEDGSVVAADPAVVP